MSLSNRLINTNAGGGASAFGVISWLGNGSATRSISGLNFTPSFVIIYANNGTTSFFDRRGGVGKYYPFGKSGYLLASYPDTLKSFDDGGITVGNNSRTNSNNINYVAWCWDAGQTQASNTDGNTQAAVYSNPEGGVSVGTYDGNASLTFPTVGHGLGVSPNMIMVKNDYSFYGRIWHSGMNNNNALGQVMPLQFDSLMTNANELTWGDVYPTTTVFAPKGSAINEVYKSGYSYRFWSFAQVENLSHFGRFLGTFGEIQVNLPFQPDFVMIKSTNEAARSWQIVDSVRGNNVIAIFGEAEAAASKFELNENGFVVNNNRTSGNKEYIYVAYKIN